jgi:hypothetical protein
MISYLPTILSFWSCALASKTYKYLSIYSGRYLHNTQHTCNGFRGIFNFSELLWNSISNSCSSQCPGASIYRLRCRMGDCSNMYGRRPDRQQCDRIFWKFHWKSFLFKSRVRTVRHWRPDGRMSSTSNFHIRLSRVRTKGDERLDGWTSTCNFHICYAPVQTMRGRRPNGWSRIGNFLNKIAHVRTGNHIVRTVYQSSLILNLERIWSWSITDGRPDGLLRCPDRCKLEQKRLDTVKGPDRKIRRPDRWCLSVWRPDGITRRPDWFKQWTNWRPDGMTRRPDGWQGI